jgi:hypothetical protein
MASPDVNEAVKKFENFLRQIELGPELSKNWTEEPFRLLTRGDSTVILSGEDAEGFGEIVHALHEAIAFRRTISKEMVSHLASECLLEVVTSHDSKEGSPFDAQLQTSLQELKRLLFAPDVPWRFILPIGGLAPSGLPMTVGQVHFKFAD